MLMGPPQRRHSCQNRTHINIPPSRLLPAPTPASTRIPGLILLALLALFAPAALADEFKNDFSLYPKAAQACLDAAAASSGCAATTNQEMNKCLCGGTAFALSTASCVGRQSPGDLQAVYTIMSTSCSDSKVNMVVPKDQFLATASAAAASAPPASTTTLPPATFTTTFTTMISNTPTTITTVITTAAAAQTTGPAPPTPTPTPATSDGGMSSMAKTGIIAGAVVAGVAIIAILIVFILRHRRKRAAAEEAHPMLPVGPIDGAGTGGGGGVAGGPFKDQLSPSPYTATPSTAHGWKTDEAKWGQHQITPSPSPLSFHSHQQHGWGYDPTSGGYGQQAPPYTTQVFEAPGLEPQKPVEMPATPAPVPDWVRQHQQPQHFMHTPHQPQVAGLPLFPDNAQRRPQNRPPGSPSVHYIPHGT
ncbi:hypothetical protein RB595_006813 [Gaeumannomyces hyphopodioides]